MPFPWFKPRCTLDAQARPWLESRWRWLGEQFPDVLLDSANILPTPEFFPDAYQPKEAAVELLARRVCQYMDVAFDLIDLQFYTDDRRLHLVNEQGDAIASAAGTYQEGDTRFIIRIERGDFDHPMALVGTIAHELAHVRLLGEGRLDRGVFDNELLTDLTVVYHGLGVFLANHPRHWHSDLSTWPGSDLYCPRYMTTPLFGYALALRSWLREEETPKWIRHLRSAPRSEFKASLRYLKSTEAKTAG